MPTPLTPPIAFKETPMPDQDDFTIEAYGTVTDPDELEDETEDETASDEEE